MKKRIIALSWAVILFCSSCAPQKPTTSVKSVEKSDLHQMQIERKDVVPLFFYLDEGEKTGEKTVVELRSVEIDQSETRAKAAVEELLRGPSNFIETQAVSPFISSIRSDLKMLLKEVQVSGNIANVDLYSESGASDSGVLIRSRLIIAKTLADYLGIDTVNVFFNGDALGFGNDGFVLGGMRLGENIPKSPNEYLAQIKQQAKDPLFPQQITATLYFPDKTGRFLLCEAHQIEIMELSKKSLAEAILREMMKGPRDIETMSPIAQSAIQDFKVQEEVDGIREQQAMPIKEEDGTKPIDTLSEEEMLLLNPISSRLRNKLIVRINGKAMYSQISKQAVVCSLMSVITDINGVAVFFEQDIGDTQRNVDYAKVMRRIDFLDLVGDIAPVYFASKDGRRLRSEMHAVSQSKREDPYQLTMEIINGPLANDKFDPVLPDTIGEKDIYSAKISNQTAIVDISEHFFDELQEMSASKQFLALYSLVNTLCEIPLVQEVQILVEGEVVEKIGSLYIAKPLMKNPGLNRI